MTIAIAPSSIERLPQVAEFLAACWKSAYAGIIDQEWLDSSGPSERISSLMRRVEKGDSFALTAIDDGRIVGAAVFGESTINGYEDDGEVTAIYLDRSRIGTGLGAMLLQAAEERLIGSGRENLVLDVLAANERAISFYRKRGYALVREATAELGGKQYPLIVMRKPVPMSSAAP